MKGNFFNVSAEIKDGERVVARIDRKLFNIGQMFGSKQTYCVTIAPNVDMALVVAMCICLDERVNERSGGEC